MNREETIRFMRHKLQVATNRSMYVTLRWGEAKDIITALEGKAEDGRVSAAERQESEGKDQSAQRLGHEIKVT